MAQLTPVSSERLHSPINQHTMGNASSRDVHATKRRRLLLPRPEHSLAERYCPPTNTNAVDSTCSRDAHSTKRRRLSPPSLERSQTESDIENLVPTLLTPPKSSPVLHTMSLKLIIPYTEPTKEDLRTLAIRRACAQRWQSKLQRPFPTQKEIKQAYKLKLMRHYPNALTVPEPNFIKPRIETSTRVDGLLRRFPLETNCTMGRDGRAIPVYDIYRFEALSTRAQDFREMEVNHSRLRYNRGVTASDFAQRSAWENFSTRERSRIDRGREAMMQSGLHTDDLNMENQGRQNNLPEWKKTHTGRFAIRNIRKMT